ncbi:hypothetical protein IQ272_12895 [Chroococcidiopsidales cyanobacterium LEGE 13417]|uniref:hypothetical protein n=1 Tax=Chroococcidiopsis sp. CCALA 051 TaxID=869949 RepID=UPI001304E8CE|nr:hypothetical protein [Chroococcidiopsis sp. CCALA 051]MBE9017014.1 hypothetical protein [Chroococcidiopsidales cyanobacterium LEGE 13417]
MIAILDCVDDICRGAQLCAPTRRVLHPIENRYEQKFTAVSVSLVAQPTPTGTGGF